MPAFFLTFLAVAMAMLAGRDAVRVARLQASLGWTGPLFATVLLAAAAGAGLASWIADSIAPLIRDSFKPVVVAIALGLAGAEVLLRQPPPTPREPTRSMGAITLVLLLGMVTDASGFIILSMALATNAALFAAMGGALGAVVVLSGAVVAGSDWELLPLRAIRLVIGGLLLVAAVLIALLGWR